MSANLDLVRSIYAAHERGDFSSSQWADPEIEFVVLDGPAPGSWTGVTGMGEAWHELMSVWADFRVEIDEYRELDDERVIVLHRFSGRGKASGVELGHLAARTATLFYIRNGKVTRHILYTERDRAFADLGLTPDAGT